MPITDRDETFAPEPQGRTALAVRGEMQSASSRSQWLSHILERVEVAKFDGEITIDRPIEVVFDFVADQTNEPQYNPNMVRAAKDTAGPIGKGTRFISAVRSAGRTAEMLIEVTGYERPRLLASVTTMKQADIEYTLMFTPVRLGTRMRWSGLVQPKGAFRLLGPLFTWVGNRQEQRIWASLKAHLEGAPGAGT